MRPLGIYALALVGLLAATPAGASPDPRARRVTVRIDDLDAATATGAAARETRFRAAAIQVCGPAPLRTFELARAHAFRTCRKAAIADAHHQLARADVATLQIEGRHAD